MGEAETELEMVERHVRRGTEIVAKQRGLVAQLDDLGLPTEEARALLTTFEGLQREHVAHLARVQKSGSLGTREASPAPADPSPFAADRILAELERQWAEIGPTLQTPETLFR